MVPPVVLLLQRVAWFDRTVPLGARVAWLTAAVAAGTAAWGGATLLLGGADVAAFRGALRRRLSARRSPRA
jgi:hypothetical protein